MQRRLGPHAGTFSFLQHLAAVRSRLLDLAAPVGVDHQGVIARQVGEHPQVVPNLVRALTKSTGFFRPLHDPVLDSLSERVIDHDLSE